MFLVIEGGEVYNLDFVHSIFIKSGYSEYYSLTILFANGGGETVIKKDKDEEVVKRCLSNLLEDMTKDKKVIALRW